MIKNVLDKMGVIAVGSGRLDGESLYIEIRGVYDGWSVEELSDGTLINRWPEDDYRYKATQEWIDKYRKLE